MTSKEKREKIMRYEAIRNKICLNPDLIGMSFFIPAEYRNNFSFNFAVLIFSFFCIKTKEQAKKIKVLILCNWILSRTRYGRSRRKLEKLLHSRSFEDPVLMKIRICTCSASTDQEETLSERKSNK